MLRLCLLSLALAAPLAGLSADTPPPVPAAAPAYVRPPAPGQLIDIGGRRLHVLCKGPTQGPTVLFEAGLSQYTANSTYGKAQDLIAAKVRVCVYDRAGLGWSDAAPGARTHLDMVEDLHKLTRALKLDKPFILVGHSMGGLIARLYTRRYPKDVAAMVLVEASPEGFIFAPGNADSRKAIVQQLDQALARAEGDRPVVPMAAGTPGEVQLAFTPGVLRAVRQEYEAIDRTPEAWRKPGGYGSLGSRPLIVIRRGKTATPPSEADRRWQEWQQSLLGLSTDSKLIVAEKSGHVVPYDQPEIVAAAIEELLGKILRHGRKKRLA